MIVSHKSKTLLILMPLVLFGVSVIITSVLILKPQGTKTKAGEADVVLSLIGAPRQQPGTTGTVTMRLNTGGTQANSVEGKLRFSKDTLRIDSIEAGSNFSILLAKNVNGQAGTANFSAGATLGEPLPRVAEVVKLTVSFLSEGIGNISFEFREGATDDTNVNDPENPDGDLLKKVENYSVPIGTTSERATDSATATPSPSPTPGPNISPPSRDATRSATPPPGRKKGDISGTGGQPDGAVNNFDLTALIAKIGKAVGQSDLADLNGDKTVNVLDYAQLITLMGK